MNTKLTLKLDKSVIEKAKKYATINNTSVSRIVESYLKLLVDGKHSNNDENIEITPFIKSMKSGIKVPVDYDYKKHYSQHLMEKYK